MNPSPSASDKPVKGEQPAPDQQDILPLLHQVPVTPNTNHSDHLQVPAQKSRRKRGGSLPGHLRRAFSDAKKAETANTRRNGACEECAIKKRRCHESHRVQVALSFESPVQQSEFGQQRNALPPARLPYHDGHQTNHLVAQWLNDPVRYLPVVGQVVLNRDDVSVGSFDARTSDVSSYVDSRSNASFAPSPHRVQKLSSAHSAHKTANKSHQYTRSVPPDQEDLIRGPVPREIRPRPRANNQQHRSARRRNGVQQSQNQNLRPPSPPIITRSLPPASEGLTQNADTDFSSSNSFPHSLSMNDPSFGSSYTGTQFDDVNHSMSSANYGQTMHASQSTSSPPAYGFQNDNLSPFQPNLPAQNGYYPIQPAGSNQGIAMSNNIQPHTMSSSFGQGQSFDNHHQAYLPQDNLLSHNESSGPEIDLLSNPNNRSFFDPANSGYNDTAQSSSMPPILPQNGRLGPHDYQTRLQTARILSSQIERPNFQSFPGQNNTMQPRSMHPTVLRDNTSGLHDSHAQPQIAYPNYLSQHGQSNPQSHSEYNSTIQPRRMHPSFSRNKTSEAYGHHAQPQMTYPKYSSQHERSNPRSRSEYNSTVQPRNMPSSVSRDETSGTHEYHAQPQNVHRNYSSQNERSNTQSFHGASQAALSDYYGTASLPQFGQQAVVAHRLPIRAADPTHQAQLMTDYLNSSDNLLEDGNITYPNYERS